MLNQLLDKVVVITGASSGIGEATARLLATEGCRLLLAARSEDKIARLARELGPRATALRTDVCNGDDVSAMVEEALRQYGRIDVLFANAGIYSSGEVATGDNAAWDRLIDTNLKGVIKCSQAVLPSMVKNGGGDIILTSSISGFVEGWSEPVYAASKHGVQAFGHILRKQVAKDGVRVGIVAPGKVANDLWGLTDEEIADQVESGQALRSEDVARAVGFMISQPSHVAIRDLVMVPHNANL